MAEHEWQQRLAALLGEDGADLRHLGRAERERIIEDRLEALLQARYAAPEVRLSDAARRAMAARLREAARAHGDGSAAAAEAVARRNGRRPMPVARAPRPGARWPAGAARWGAAALAMAVAGLLIAVGWGQLNSRRPAPTGPRLVDGMGGEGLITLVRAPEGALVPEGMLDAAGALHLVYGQAGNGYYVRAGQGGQPSSTPVRLNRQPGSLLVGGEHGPRLASGKGGTLHVVWLARGPRGAGIRYTRSTDGGRTFEPERNVAETQTDCHSATVAADQEGNVWVFWLDGVLRGPANPPMAAPIFMARSTDDGRTFTRKEAVRHDHPGPACACCRLEARVRADNRIYLSFRSAYRNVRDVFLLTGQKSENDFHAVRISEDDWRLAECPGSGAPFSFDARGRLLASWMSRGRVYWAAAPAADPAAARFGPRIPAPRAARAENYPLVLANRRGDVMLIWTEERRVRWARYTPDGRFTGRQGIAGDLRAPDKPTAFVGRDDRFHIVL
jgi:hypothetical protein